MIQKLPAALLRRGFAYFPDRAPDGRSIAGEARYGDGPAGLGWYGPAGLRVDDVSAHPDFRPYASEHIAKAMSSSVWGGL